MIRKDKIHKLAKKVVAIALATVTVASIMTTATPATTASAASYITSYAKYATPSSTDDYAYWDGRKTVKAKGTTTSEIKWMQAALNYCIAKEGLKTSYIDVDGSFGPASKSACLAFQKVAKLTADGKFGPSTIKKMKEILGDKKANSLVAKKIAKYNLVWPVSEKVKSVGKVSSKFGYRNTGIKGASTYHCGIDIAVKKGTDVYSVSNGIIVKTGSNSVRGKYVMVYHPKLDVTTIYQHLDKIDVKVNQNVEVGDVIAKSGDTGIGSAHLHFGMVKGKTTDVNHDQKRYGKVIDPLSSNCEFTGLSTFMKAKMTKPTGVKASVKKTGALWFKQSEITFKWNEHAYAQRYEVLVYDKTTKNRSVVKLDGKSIISTTGTSIKYNNKVIKPGHTYEIMVVAICNKNGTEYRSGATYLTVKA